MASPLMSLGSGFLRAVFAAFDTLGAPWIMRGSFIRLVSNLAGARGVNISMFVRQWEKIEGETNLG